MPPSRHGYFYPILILLVKMMQLPQQYTNTVHWLQALPLPIAAKGSILNMAKILDPSLKTPPCTKTSQVSCENQSFFLFSKCGHLYWSHCVFLCYFLQYDEVSLINLLDGCYHYLVFIIPVNGYSKSKVLVKEQISL